MVGVIFICYGILLGIERVWWWCGVVGVDWSGWVVVVGVVLNVFNLF